MGGLLLETGLAYYAKMHPGAVGLVEQDGDFTQVHVVRNWCYLGSAASIVEAKQLSTVAAGFDADGYKILVRPMLTGVVPVVGL
jgi:excinuclease Cho